MNTSWYRGLLDLSDEIVSAAPDTSVEQLACRMFEWLEPNFHISSGVFIKIDPATWQLSSMQRHNIAPELSDAYFGHYMPSDPYVVSGACLTRPGEVARFSDVNDIGRVSEHEYGDFMRRVPYFHAVAIIPFLRGMPFGVISVHRRRNMRNFDHAEMHHFRDVARRFARDVDYRDLCGRLAENSPQPVISLSAEGDILSATDAARDLLVQLRGGAQQIVPAPNAPARIWRIGHRAWRVRSTQLSPSCLLLRFGGGVGEFNSRGKAAKSPFCMPVSITSPLAVSLEPLPDSPWHGTNLGALNFTPRERQVLTELINGSTPRQIAQRLGISINTVREYIQDIYRKAGVHTLHQLLRKLGFDN